MQSKGLSRVFSNTTVQKDQLFGAQPSSQSNSHMHIPFHTSVAVVQLLSCVWLSVTPWTAARQASLSFTISQSLLKLMFIESVVLSNHLILCYPHPLLLLPSIFPRIRVFSNELALRIRWPKYHTSEVDADITPFGRGGNRG